VRRGEKVSVLKFFTEKKLAPLAGGVKKYFQFSGDMEE
jgi:hypothetical protein